LTVNDFDNYNSRLFEPNIFTFLLGWFPLIFESSFKDGVILLGRGNDQRVEIPSIKSPLFDSIIWTWIFFFLFFNLEKILSLVILSKDFLWIILQDATISICLIQIR
jgi:hypothetical protein